MYQRTGHLLSLLGWSTVSALLLGFQAPLTSIEFPKANAVIKLEFGLTDSEPLQWEGEISASSGEVLSTWGWHFTMPPGGAYFAEVEALE